ncbi:AAEL008710-PA [Aedes aegypti]|uniref:AAEL008710-PA n=1 Tax=Aedes aegypti TaxID=7159 RepID=Q16XZ6_AEDAE|nr:AAEL008710-PA [Aedes aegypti]
MGCCCSSSDSQDITPVPPRPGLPEEAPSGVPYGLNDGGGSDQGATGYNVNG